jgi:hypothetical protein
LALATLRCCLATLPALRRCLTMLPCDAALALKGQDRQGRCRIKRE